MSLDTIDGSRGPGQSSDTLGDAFYPLYDRLFSEDSDFVADVEKKLAQARMTETVEMYLSRSLGIGVISGLVLWILGTLLGYFLFATGIIVVNSLLGATFHNETLIAIIETLRVPFLIFVTGLVLGTIGFGLGFGALVAVPYSRASSRKREINMLLTDAVSFMYALSVGGLNQLEILEAMANADDTYGEVAREFQSIVQETEYFDTDYRTAVRNQAMETPSSELSQFLTDMLSIINSGGDMEAFLSDKKDKHMRTAKQQQELTLETLELFGEMYMTLSLFPLLLIIILVIMQMLGEASVRMLYGVVYGLVPLTGLGFLVLISTVKKDEPGDGYLNPTNASDRLETTGGGGFLDLGLIDSYTGEYDVFDRIKSREGTHETIEVLKAPHVFFKNNPLYTLALTVPIALVVVVTAMVTNAVPLTWDGTCAGKNVAEVACSSSNVALDDNGEKIVRQAGIVQKPVWSTFILVYAPLYITLLPLTIFREWNVRSRRSIINKLSENLRKLASANDTGQTLLESLKTVSATTSGKLATEFETMHKKVDYGMSLKEALVEFNNKYHIPRLARTVKLISKAQEASSEITDVLSTAAQASENQDDIERERKSRTRMQVVIILMTYLTLLAVMAILKTQFLDVMSGVQAQTGGGSGGGASGMGGGFGQNVNTSLLSLLFFHAVTMQAILSGLISGYIRDADLLSGLKFVVILLTIALVVWTGVA